MVENKLVIKGCQPVKLQHVLTEQPFISGHVSFAESDEASLDYQNMEAKQKEYKKGLSQQKIDKKGKQRVQKKPAKI